MRVEWYKERRNVCLFSAYTRVERLVQQWSGSTVERRIHKDCVHQVASVEMIEYRIEKIDSDVFHRSSQVGKANRRIDQLQEVLLAHET